MQKNSMNSAVLDIVNILAKYNICIEETNEVFDTVKMLLQKQPIQPHNTNRSNAHM